MTLVVSEGETAIALSQLYKALEHQSFNDYELTIIDSSRNPQAGKALGVSNTPALLKQIGNGNIHYADDFSDFTKMRSFFGFKTISTDSRT